MQNKYSNHITWSHPDLGVDIQIYYEKGSREEPPYAEIEAVYDGCTHPPKDIQRLFDHEAIMDDFWKYRPDLGDY